MRLISAVDRPPSAHHLSRGASLHARAPGNDLWSRATLDEGLALALHLAGLDACDADREMSLLLSPLEAAQNVGRPSRSSDADESVEIRVKSWGDGREVVDGLSRRVLTALYRATESAITSRHDRNELRKWSRVCWRARRCQLRPEASRKVRLTFRTRPRRPACKKTSARPRRLQARLRHTFRLCRPQCRAPVLPGRRARR